MTEAQELILRVGAEGGDIKLYGKQTNHGWVYLRRVNDRTPLLIDEPGIEHESDIASSWEAAVRLLDDYPWWDLRPVFIHPQFRECVWNEINRRGAHPVSVRQIERWRELCDGPTPSTD